MASDPHSRSRSGPTAGPAEPAVVTGGEAAAHGAGAIARFGTPDQVKRYVTAAVDGDLIITCALAEPGGDDLLRPAALAQRSADGWLLSGTKTMVPFAGQAGG